MATLSTRVVPRSALRPASRRTRSGQPTGRPPCRHRDSVRTRSRAGRTAGCRRPNRRCAAGPTGAALFGSRSSAGPARPVQPTGVDPLVDRRVGQRRSCVERPRRGEQEACDGIPMRGDHRNERDVHVPIKAAAPPSAPSTLHPLWLLPRRGSGATDGPIRHHNGCKVPPGTTSGAGNRDAHPGGRTGPG